MTTACLMSWRPLSDVSRREVCLFLAALLAGPLFVRIGGPTLIWLPDTASAKSGGFNLPIGAMLIIAFALWLAIRGGRTSIRMPRTTLEAAALMFLAVAVVTFLAGLVTRPGIYNVLYFAQSVGPL